MTARVYSLWTGQEVGPATLDAMQHQAKRQREERDAELLRQIDLYVEAYTYAWKGEPNDPIR